jgi:ABC-type multidrug transport system ATPase subunit
MFQGQIFSLLGHNGAGKTTTIEMITGMLAPTNGYLAVYGQTKVEEIRKLIGVCPQHDRLYDDFTVEEHLNLFGELKGLKGH